MIKIRKPFLLSLLLLVFFSMTSFSQKINQVNKEGKRIGVWKKYYDNGKVRYQGQFENGREVGTFKFYIATSNYPSIIKKFSSTSDSAYVEFYTNKGKLKTKGTMLGKKRVGKWVYFFTNGKLFSEEHYKDGKLDGILKNYYRNGNITEETNYKNGLKNGTSKIYTESGVLIEDVNYINNKLHGLAKYYDLKGNLVEKGNYEHNKKIGKWEFYSNGELVKKKKRKKLTLDKK